MADSQTFVTLTPDELNSIAEVAAERALRRFAAEHPPTQPEPRPKLLSEKDAASALNISPRTLQRWRLDGRFALTSPRKPIRYSDRDLQAVLKFMQGGRNE